MNVSKSVSMLTIVLLVAVAFVGCEQGSPTAAEPVTGSEISSPTALLKGDKKGHDEVGKKDKKDKKPKKQKDPYPAFAGTGSPSETGAYSYTLWAGKTRNVGTVSIAYSQGQVSVMYTMTAGDLLKDVHVYLWTDESSIPSKRPAPGQSEYKAKDLYSSTYTMTIPETLDPGQVIFVSAHASLVTPEGDEDDDGENDDEVEYEKSGSAYAGGELTPLGFPKGRGAWWGYVEYTAQVQLYTFSGTVSFDGTCSGNVGLELTSTASGTFTAVSANGTFEFTGVPAGSYTLTANFGDGSQAVVQSYEVDVPSETPFPVTIVCPETQSNSVTGTISFNGNCSGVVNLELTSTSGTYTTSSTGGTYEFTNIPDGIYTLTGLFYPDGGGLGSAQTYPFPVVVPSVQSYDLVFDCPTGGGPL